MSLSGDTLSKRLKEGHTSLQDQMSRKIMISESGELLCSLGTAVTEKKPVSWGEEQNVLEETRQL